MCMPLCATLYIIRDVMYLLGMNNFHIVRAISYIIEMVVNRKFYEFWSQTNDNKVLSKRNDKANRGNI